MAKQKTNAIDAFFSSFAEGDEEVSFKFTSDVMSQKLPVIHSGSYLIDDALSSGGLPKGRLIQYYGPTASGKTLLAMLAIVQAQKDNKKAVQVFIDAEQTYDPTWAAKLGVDPKRVLLVDGDLAVNGRRCFTMLLGEPKADAKGILVGKKTEGLFDKIVKEEINCNLVVLDSLGAIIPPGEDVSSVGKVNMAKMARFLTTELKKLSLEVKKANVPMIIINHKRDNLDPYGVDHTFAGGNSYAHHLSANIYFEAVQRKDSYILDGNENKVGGLIRVTVEKSKFGPHPRKCEIKVDFRIGVVGVNEEVAQLAVNYGVVVRPNTKSYEYGDKKWVGAANFHDAIKESPELMNELLQKIEEVREKNRALKLEEQQAAKKQVLEEGLEEDESEDSSDESK
jgi:recombination protein RecA